jgi:hypothetical protein
VPVAVTSGLAGADRVSVTVMRAPVTGTRVSVGVARAVGPVVVR